MSLLFPAGSSDREESWVAKDSGTNLASNLMAFIGLTKESRDAAKEAGHDEAAQQFDAYTVRAQDAFARWVDQEAREVQADRDAAEAQEHHRW